MSQTGGRFDEIERAFKSAAEVLSEARRRDQPRIRVATAGG